MPPAEVEVTDALVGRLLSEQHPDLATMPLALVANGWDNVIYRLGEHDAVRVPRRVAAVPLIRHEQRWLPELASRLPLPIPAPVRVGYPTDFYPWPWSVTPWFSGEPAAVAPPLDQDDTVVTLGGFLAALHVEAPPDAPPNSFRGGPLAERDAPVRERVEQLGSIIDGPAVLRLWESIRDTSPWPGPPCWLHGDLHTANLLVAGGRLAAVIDFGDITAGDPATDLAVAWQLFDADHRDAMFERLRVDDATRLRARGWAIHLSLAYLANSADHPLLAEVGRSTLAAVIADERG
jgi:aminoglycoside phosphotransferase (APT) family kinase protein